MSEQEKRPMTLAEVFAKHGIKVTDTSKGMRSQRTLEDIVKAKPTRADYSQHRKPKH